LAMRFSPRASLISLVPITLLMAGAGASVPAADLERFEFTEVHMGMPVRVVLYAADRPRGEAAAKAAFTRIAELDSKMSDYRPDSEISLLSKVRAGAWTPLSKEVCAVLERALFIARQSEGAFDPTVGPLVDLWRSARNMRTMPAAREIDFARSRVGWRHVTLECDAPRIRLALASMRFDLGGLAKGFILQEALNSLRASGVTQALLEAGGDLVAGDAPPDRTGWQIDVPHGSEAFRARARELTTAALATSGPDIQFFELDGVRYSHVIDPRSGRPLTSNRIVSVIARDGATADALATALSVLEDNEAARFLRHFPGVHWTSANR
jgi:thiamine biosynthesis lipoprotein